jgi:hypothetical protein
MLINLRLRRLTFSIELATGRVRPLADKGLLDPPNIWTGCQSFTQRIVDLADRAKHGQRQRDRPDLIDSVEAIGPYCAITARLAHVMHNDEIAMIVKKVWKAPLAR